MRNLRMKTTGPTVVPLMKKVLLVDDQPDIRLSVATHLTKKFHVEIIEASNGAEAIELLKREQFAVIVSDLNMVSEHGMDLFSFFEENYQIPSYFIFFTGEKDASKFGYDAVFIEKPNFNELIELINDIEVFNIR